jgi:ketosteroid isomerase-like protein
MPQPQPPEECDRRFAEYVESGSLDDLVALYEPGASLVQRDGTVAKDHPEIRRALARLTNVPTRIRMHIVGIVESGGLAVVYNDWFLRSTDSNGAETERRGQAIEIVRRQADGRWLFAIDDPFGRDQLTRAFLAPPGEAS